MKKKYIHHFDREYKLQTTKLLDDPQFFSFVIRKRNL